MYSEISLPAGATDIFSKTPLPVVLLEFTTLNKQQERQTHILEEGQITYPAFPRRMGATIPETALLRMDKLRDFHIEKLRYTESGDLQLRMSGVAGDIKSEQGSFTEDYRLSLLDRLELKDLAAMELCLAIAGEPWR